ncbi:hypothetical protein KSP40_PGU013974 [Platanthera guangdongensis]|uniref:Uncharacterized protein n=1 Tax=Platanthera guangdongensis TaxID=2320717 RepID=A0ABR2LCR9_9ASPA
MVRQRSHPIGKTRFPIPAFHFQEPRRRRQLATNRTSDISRSPSTSGPDLHRSTANGSMPAPISPQTLASELRPPPSSKTKV